MNRATAISALTALLLLAACGGSPPEEPRCRCVGELPGGTVDLTCGESVCLAGTGYRCVESSQVADDPSACEDASVGPSDGGDVSDAGVDSGGACVDECAPGESRCAGGRISQCEADPGGCWRWGLSAGCDFGVCADDQTCAACVDQCPTAGDTSCSGGLLRTCEVGGTGCLAWSAAVGCPFGCADGRSCATCEDTCPANGATECADGSLRTCAVAADGCLAWSALTPCAEGFCADATRCGTCTHTCPADGATECTAGFTRTCVTDARGCRSWAGSTRCADGFCADATSCGTCGAECASGATSCEAGALRTCAADANGCLVFGAPVACADGFCADATRCGTCTHECTTLGATECTGGALRTCIADANGCRAWGAPMACADGYCEDATSCGMCAHECGAVGLTCAADDVASCFADARGCRYEVRAACGTGCTAAACDACTSHGDPVVGEVTGMRSNARRSVRVGSLLYVSTYDGLAIIDASDPTAPALVSLFAVDVRDVAVVGTHAFAVGMTSGLSVVDVSTPSAPALVTTLAISGNPASIEVAGGYAYVLGDALSIIDVSTPSAPTLVGSQGRPGSGEAMAVAGDRVFLADTVNGIRVVDVSTKTAPALVGAIPLSGAYTYDSLVVVGTQLLAGARFSSWPTTHELRSFDIATAGMPMTGSELLHDMSSSRVRVHVMGDRAYVAGPASVPVFDISDPAHPVFVERVQCPSTQTLRINDLGDGRHLVCGRYSGLSIVDLQEGARFVGDTTQVDTRAVAATAGLLLVGARGLSIYDVSDPAAPASLATWGTAQVYDVAVDGDLAYVGFYGHTEIVSIADPRAPALVGTIPVRGSEIALLAGHAYVLESSNVSVWNVVAPGAPTRVGNLYPTAASANSVVAAGNIIVVGRSSSVDTFLVTTPSAPLVAGALSDGGVVLSGSPGVVYVSSGSSPGFRIVDVSDPTTPTVIGSLPGYDPDAFVLQGDFGYGIARSLVGVVDLSVPTAPALIEQVSVLDYPISRDLAVQGAYVFATVDDGFATVHACR